jgi:protein-tyrosine phosphatase
MPNWVIPGVLATSPRPGYTPGPEYRVEAHAIESWLTEAREFGIASVICLIDESQLWLYRQALPEGGLLDRYRRAGLGVAHVPAADQQTEPFTAEQYAEALAAFESLPKPVLVHCSAGHDRTYRVVDYILRSLDFEAANAAAG